MGAEPIVSRGWTAPVLARGLVAVASLAATFALPAIAQDIYRQQITHNPARCAAGAESALLVSVSGVKNADGTIRIQSYRGTRADWLRKGKWIYRIEVPARAGTMTLCMPVPGPGEYGIAVRHDTNGNGKTDLDVDGGAMSNDPYIGVFNLGKPGYRQTRVRVGNQVKAISMAMKYRRKD